MNNFYPIHRTLQIRDIAGFVLTRRKILDAKPTITSSWVAFAAGLCCTVLYCTVLYFAVLYFAVLYFAVLYLLCCPPHLLQIDIKTLIIDSDIIGYF